MSEMFGGDELAINVWKSKYAALGETHYDQMHRRMAKEFARIEDKYEFQKSYTQEQVDNLSEYGRTRDELLEENIYELFKDFKYIVPQGSIMATLGTDVISSLSNCWVSESPYDSYGGILKTDSDLAYYYKRRGGVGSDISNLRPKGTITKNTAKSSTGVVSFMPRFSNTTREVAMEGRRGALMLSLNMNHPDVMDFIKVKRDGVSITGANISIRLGDEFMRAVENNEDYFLKFPCDVKGEDVLIMEDSKYLRQMPYNTLEEMTYQEGFDHKKGYLRKIKAREYWDEIVKSAKNHAEPGLMYWDNALDYDPAAVYKQFKPISTNPCFTGDSKILTAEGYKKFSEISGSNINLVNLNGEIVKGNVWSNGVKSIVKVETWNNDVIFCTEDHIFMNSKGESKAIKDMVGDRLTPFYKMKSDVNIFTKLGFIQGDGTLSRLTSESHLGLEISIGKNDQDIFRLFDIVPIEGKRSYYVQEFTEILKELEFDDKVLPERGLPNTYFNWNEEQKQNFLQGLYSANGSVIKARRVSFKTTSKLLVDQLTRALLKLGIGSYFTTNQAKKVKFSNGEYLCKESYDINISKQKDVITFAEKIGFVHKYKKESLKELISLKAPKVKKLTPYGEEEVFDFNLEDDTHWGVVEGHVVHNCGEQYLNANDSCRLMALNLYSFVENPFTDKSKIDYKKLYEVSYEHARLGDDLVDLELEYIQRIINKIESDPEPEEIKRGELELWKKSYNNTKAGRRIGLGITALADMVAAMGFKYDSDESLTLIDKVMNTKMEAELDCLIDLAVLRGTFEGWDKDKEFVYENRGWNKFYTFLCSEYPVQTEKMKKFGRRSVSWSTIAPTGSVSILTQTSSGCEPLFMPYYMRRKKINPNEEGTRIDFTDETGDNWQEFAVLHSKFKDWIKLNYTITEEDILLFDAKTLGDFFYKSPWYGSTANDIDWIKRNEVQSILQRYTTNAISSTLNLPATVTEKEVSDIYMSGWKMGLKGQTVYVEGSRSGVLVDNNKKEVVAFNENHAPKRPKRLEAKLVRFNNNKEKWIAFVGILDGKPYEIFTGLLDDIKIPAKVEEGEIVKVKDGDKKRYDFMFDGNTIESIDKIFNNDYWNYGKLVSGMLRHGMPLHFAVDIISNLKFEEDHISTWKNGVARTLKKFIVDGKAEGMKCRDCNSTNVIFEEGCSRCLDCGSSKCG